MGGAGDGPAAGAVDEGGVEREEGEEQEEEEGGQVEEAQEGNNPVQGEELARLNYFSFGSRLLGGQNYCRSAFTTIPILVHSTHLLFAGKTHTY